MGLSVCVGFPSHAAESPGEARTEACPEAKEALTARVQRAYRALSAAYRSALPGPEGVRLRQEKVAKLVSEHTRGERFTREVLRTPWGALTEGQRVRFSRVLGALLERRVSRALSAPTRYALEVTGVEAGERCTDARVSVRLQDRVKERKPTQVHLRFDYQGGDWRVWDLSSADASFVQTWRPRLVRVFRERGTKGLEAEVRRLASSLGVTYEGVEPSPQ